MPFVIFPMLFGGGTIPTYLLIKNLHMIGTYWALLIPGAIYTYNLLVVKAFFENLPEELFESARMDGASEFCVLRRIVVPLSKPVIMTGCGNGQSPQSAGQGDTQTKEDVPAKDENKKSETAQNQEGKIVSL